MELHLNLHPAAMVLQLNPHPRATELLRGQPQCHLPHTAHPLRLLLRLQAMEHLKLLSLAMEPHHRHQVLATERHHHSRHHPTVHRHLRGLHRATNLKHHHQAMELLPQVSLKQSHLRATVLRLHPTAATAANPPLVLAGTSPSSPAATAAPVRAIPANHHRVTGPRPIPEFHHRAPGTRLLAKFTKFTRQCHL
ncbi:Hypothetical protein NTJ_00717 [Nesidiocoris tenuis]|uniref:Uncharacterized protein n=1 Tax=Nesidiocoris tenuis TaxID=355587 RepID=A0ABN7A6P0_9HEMI|nr:Hypothetical protein NTJ_00717 [Nesidiocoris tenuis]